MRGTEMSAAVSAYDGGTEILLPAVLRSGQAPPGRPQQSAKPLPEKGSSKGSGRVKRYRGSRNPERDKEMLRLRTEHKQTLQQIGDRFGLCRERVRQCIKRANA